MLNKPESVARNKFRSEMWDEIVSEGGYTQADALIISLLCYWYEILETCMSEIDFGEDGLQVAYENNMKDIKEVPQIGTIKKATVEIRALERELAARKREPAARGDGAQLYVFQKNRQSRASGSA